MLNHFKRVNRSFNVAATIVMWIAFSCIRCDLYISILEICNLRNADLNCDIRHLIQLFVYWLCHCYSPESHTQNIALVFICASYYANAQGNNAVEREIEWKHNYILICKMTISQWERSIECSFIGRQRQKSHSHLNSIHSSTIFELFQHTKRLFAKRMMRLITHSHNTK